MLLAIEHVHSKGVIHRDIKLANFLVSHQNTIKLCDFGLATKLDGRNGLGHTQPAGTIQYMAPEMLHHKKYNCSVDIWSLGVCVYLICFGCFPYNGPDKSIMKRNIMNNSPEPSYTPVDDMPEPPPHIVDFMRRLLVHE